MTISKQGGFTLIELVVVIVILGILAVTAAPKFLDLQDEAKTSAVYGLAGGVRSALAMTYTQAIIENKQNSASATIQVEGQTVALIYGYPKDSTELEKVVTGLDEWTESPKNTDTQGYSYTYGFDSFNCVVGYIPPEETATSGSEEYVAKVDVLGKQCERVGE